MVEVKLFDDLPGREPGCFDPVFAAVGLTGRHFSFEAGGEELFVGPLLSPGPLRQPVHCLAHRRRLESSTQIGDIRSGLGGLGHDATA
jgi:hypothetical protein